MAMDQIPSTDSVDCIRPERHDPNIHHSSLSAFTTSSESSSSPWSRSSIISSNLFNHPKTPPSHAKSAVNDKPTSSLLTLELLAIGDDARSWFEAARPVHQEEHLQEPLLLQKNPFSALSYEEIETCYAAAVDARNVLRLRKAAVAEDIRDILEGLLPKLSLFVQDRAAVGTISDDIRFIKQECFDKKHPINFRALEYNRCLHPTLSKSVFEQHNILFYTIQSCLNKKGDSLHAVEQLLADPSSLCEHRLRVSLSSQR